jgi:hypothetical protein
MEISRWIIEQNDTQMIRSRQSRMVSKMWIVSMTISVVLGVVRARLETWDEKERKLSPPRG